MLVVLKKGNFAMNERNYTHIPTISCYCSDILDNTLSTPSAHFEYQMILVTSGSATMTINHKVYKLTAKTLVFISRLEYHSFIIEQTPYIRYVVSLSSDLIMSNIKDIELISIFIQRPKKFNHVLNLSDKAYGMLLPLFERMAVEYHNQQIFYVSRSVSLVVAILIDLYRAYPQYFPTRSKSSISSAVLNAQKYINDNFSKKLTLQEIADSNYMSRHTLSIAFKDIVGVTFKEYLLLFRMNEAKKLLIITDASISEIAEHVGYMNVNNFIKVFKEKEQITPLKYRRRFTKNGVT
jgi:AraC-like DNA-binding protein